MPSTINDDIHSANKPPYKPQNLTTNITPNPQHSLQLSTNFSRQTYNTNPTEWHSDGQSWYWSTNPSALSLSMSNVFFWLHQVDEDNNAMIATKTSSWTVMRILWLFHSRRGKEVKICKKCIWDLLKLSEENISLVAAVLT